MTFSDFIIENWHFVLVIFAACIFIPIFIQLYTYHAKKRHKKRVLHFVRRIMETRDLSTFEYWMNQLHEIGGMGMIPNEVFKHQNQLIKSTIAKLLKLMGEIDDVEDFEKRIEEIFKGIYPFCLKDILAAYKSCIKRSVKGLTVKLHLTNSTEEFDRIVRQICDKGGELPVNLDELLEQCIQRNLERHLNILKTTERYLLYGTFFNIKKDPEINRGLFLYYKLI